MIGSESQANIKDECLKARQRIQKHIRYTPVERSVYLSEKTESQVFLKLENIQITGSFKLRGAANKLLSLNNELRAKGVFTASSGNHGAAVSHMSQKLEIKAFVYLPSTTSSAKIKSLKSMGSEIKIVGDDCLKAEMAAKKEAQKRETCFISPYNDLKIIAGQGTVGIELMEQIPQLDAVIVPVGGGGLISGIAGFLKKQNPEISIIGAQPENSPVMYESLKAGRIIEMDSKPTLSDGTAGGIEKGSITYDFCEKYVDRFVILSEQEIAHALKQVIEKQHMLIEGAAALPVAALLKESRNFKHKNISLILSGAKISLEKLKQVL